MSFSVLDLLQHVPGGDGTNLVEQGIKHKWVELMQTKKYQRHLLKISCRENQNKETCKGQRTRRRARIKETQKEKCEERHQNSVALTASGKFSDFEDDESDLAIGDEMSDSEYSSYDESANSGKNGTNTLVHTSSGEICVSIVLVSQADIVADVNTLK